MRPRGGAGSSDVFSPRPHGHRTSHSREKAPDEVGDSKREVGGSGWESSGCSATLDQLSHHLRRAKGSGLELTHPTNEGYYPGPRSTAGSEAFTFGYSVRPELSLPSSIHAQLWKRVAPHLAGSWFAEVWRKRVGIEGGRKVPPRMTPAQRSRNHRKLRPRLHRLRRPSRTQFGHKMGTPRARTGTGAKVHHVGPLLPYQARDLDKPTATRGSHPGGLAAKPNRL